MKVKTAYLFAILALLFSCQSPAPYVEVNPPAPNFNLTGSDQKAIELADAVMAASGGRENWDRSRYFSWVFAGGRKHVWDKKTGDVRIESFKDSTTYLMNVGTMEGKVSVKNKSVEDKEELDKLLKKGKSIWINDSYWLVMPFKLKDDGVTLKYEKEDTTQNGSLADVITMTFENVGDTPDNKYEVYIDKESKLVSQWSYFRTVEQDSANFTMPWADYKKFGNILLANDHGRLKLTDIAVLDEVPTVTFTEF